MRKHAHKAIESTAIPDKLYFRIGEVARLCGVEPYVLRFWESEFPQLRPNKSGTGQRLYRKRDVELALRVRRLLHDEGYTIAGARQVFQQELHPGKKAAHPELPLRQKREALPKEMTAGASLEKLREELRELLGMLSAPPGSVPAPARPRTKAASRPAPRSGPRPGPTLFEG